MALVDLHGVFFFFFVSILPLENQSSEAFNDI